VNFSPTIIKINKNQSKLTETCAHALNLDPPVWMRFLSSLTKIFYSKEIIVSDIDKALKLYISQGPIHIWHPVDSG